MVKVMIKEKKVRDCEEFIKILHTEMFLRNYTIPDGCLIIYDEKMKGYIATDTEFGLHHILDRISWNRRSGKYYEGI